MIEGVKIALLSFKEKLFIMKYQKTKNKYQHKNGCKVYQHEQ